MAVCLGPQLSKLAARVSEPFVKTDINLFFTIINCPRLFATIRTIRTIRYSLFGTIRCSRLFAIRVFQTPYWENDYVAFKFDFAAQPHFFTGCDVTFWWMIQTQKKCQASQSVLPRPWSGQTLEIWIYNLCDASTIKSGQLIIVKNKLMSVFHASVLLLTMNVVITFT